MIPHKREWEVERDSDTKYSTILHYGERAGERERACVRVG